MNKNEPEIIAGKLEVSSKVLNAAMELGVNPFAYVLATRLPN